MGKAEDEAVTDAAPSGATDDDIAEIVRENEAGIADVMAAYEVIERAYFTATSATPDPTPGAYATNTSG